MATPLSAALATAPRGIRSAPAAGSDLRFLLLLGWKNLSRHRRRTIITAGALAVSVAMFIFMDSMLHGIDTESQRNLVWYETGSGRIVSTDQYVDVRKIELQHEIVDYRPLSAWLSERGVASTPRITFAGELFFGEGSLPVRLVGIDPATDPQVFRLPEALLPGSEFLAAGVPGLILGAWMTEDLGIAVGDFVEVRTRTRHGAVQTLELEVVGILLSPNPTVNKGVGFLPLDVVQFDLDLEGVTEIALGALRTRLGRSIPVPAGATLEREIRRLNEELASAFPGVVAVGWTELARDYLALLESDSAGNSVMLLLVFLIAAVGVSNTMLIAVYERIREFGVMRALGMDDAAIRATMVLEAGAIGLIGSLAGLAVGAAATWWLVQWGIDMSGLYGNINLGYRVTGVFRGAWNPGIMLTAVIFGVAASMAIALLPARRALRLDVVQCLRYE
jgi:ABC-type lipoprotein release transport system permease subunit